RTYGCCPQFTPSSTGELEPDRPGRAKLDSQRTSKAGITDPAILRRADVLGAVGKELGKRDPIAAAEDVSSDADPEDGSCRPSDRKPHILDCAEDFVALRQCNGIGC